MYWKDRNTITIPMDADIPETESIIRRDLDGVEMDPYLGIAVMKTDSEPEYADAAYKVTSYECDEDIERWAIVGPYGAKNNMTFDEMASLTAERVCTYVKEQGLEDLGSALDALEAKNEMSL